MKASQAMAKRGPGKNSPPPVLYVQAYASRLTGDRVFTGILHIGVEGICFSIFVRKLFVFQGHSRFEANRETCLSHFSFSLLFFWKRGGGGEGIPIKK